MESEQQKSVSDQKNEQQAMQSDDAQNQAQDSDDFDYGYGDTYTEVEWITGLPPLEGADVPKLEDFYMTPEQKQAWLLNQKDDILQMIKLKEQEAEQLKSKKQ